MPKRKLTQPFVKSAWVPSGQCSKQCFQDTEVPGLVLEVRAGNEPNRGTFYALYQDAQGQRRHQRLGRADQISLKEARSRAKAFLAQQSLLRFQAQLLPLNGIAIATPASQPVQPQGSGMSVRDFCYQQVLPHIQKHKRSWNTDVQHWENHILSEFGDAPLNRLDYPQLRQWHMNLQQKALKDSSIDRITVCLKGLLSLAVQWEYLPSNPAQKLKLINPNNQRMPSLGKTELERLLRVCSEEKNRSAALAVEFLLATGARCGEVLKAQWSHLDEERQHWTIPAENSKSKKSRTLPLNATALQVIQQLKQIPECRNGTYLFASRSGQPFRDINHTWRKIRSAAGLEDLRLHDLRHIYASLLVNSGRPLYEVQQLLGHASSKMTQRYAHLAPHRLQEATQAVDACLSFS